MPDSAEEKTEKATPKKRSDQRKEGNIFQSKEVIIAATLIATFVSLKFLYPVMESALTDNLKKFFSLAGGTTTVKRSDLQHMFIQGLITFIIAAGPMVIIAAVVAIIATVAQTKGLVTFKSLKPKFSRLNPLKGIKNLVSLKGLMELLKSILKIVILFVIIYITLSDEVSKLPKMMDMPHTQIAESVGEMIWNVVIKVIIAFIFLAALDYMYQRWHYEKQLRMTKQEVKEEYKTMEGDPKIKGKIKSKQQAMARQRMMQAVPDADVIIRNPTHFAVALKYNAEKNKAPVLIAKGEDLIALKIIEIGQEHNITIMENKPLARALYAEVEIGQEIPSEFYNPVAEILAYVYSLKEKELK